MSVSPDTLVTDAFTSVTGSALRATVKVFDPPSGTEIALVLKTKSAANEYEA